MTCELHPSLGEQEACEACQDNRPPDIGIEIREDIETSESIG